MTLEAASALTHALADHEYVHTRNRQRTAHSVRDATAETACGRRTTRSVRASRGVQPATLLTSALRPVFRVQLCLGGPFCTR